VPVGVAAGERTGRGHQPVQVGVEVVGQPVADAGLRVESQVFEGSPTGFEEQRGFDVVPPAGAPAELPAQRPGESGSEEFLDERDDVRVERVDLFLLIFFLLIFPVACRGGLGAGEVAEGGVVVVDGVFQAAQARGEPGEGDLQVRRE
jgi:hypothetical protein